VAAGTRRDSSSAWFLLVLPIFRVRINAQTGIGEVAMDDIFGLFRYDDKGIHFREVVADVEEAKRRAQELATAEGFEFFVFSYKECREIARFFPIREKPQKPKT